MSICKYRLIEKYFDDRVGWITWGALYDNCSEIFPESKVLFTAIPDDDRHIRRYLGARINELNLGLEDGDWLIGEEYADRFRLRPGLFTVEGETHKEIRQQLWERIFALPEAEPISDAPAEERYTARPVYHTLRETEEPEESQ
jgi:hypothetical protein